MRADREQDSSGDRGGGYLGHSERSEEIKLQLTTELTTAHKSPNSKAPL